MAEAPEEAPAAPAETSMSTLAGCVTGGSWWGGLIQAAKDKSASAIDFVKNDITEFTHTMQNESESIASNVRGKLNHETAVAASEKMKKGMSFILGGIKTALIIPPEDMEDDDAEPITVTSGQHIFDRAKARLHAVQIDPGTYCNEPLGSKAEFEAWKSTFELETKKGDISELLVAHVQVRALYTQLVPSTVSHADFWQRYFYKLYQLEQEERRRADLKKRADVVKDDDDLAWDDEDDWDNMGAVESKADGRASLIQDQGETALSDIASETQTENSIGNTDNIQTQSSASAESRLADEQSVNSDASASKTNTETVTSKEVNCESVVSPTDTISVSSDTSDKNVPKNSSAETLTIVSAESPSDIPDDCVAVTNIPADNPVSTEDVRTREKGDIVVVVGDNNGSDSMSPPTSESNSHNKETDDDWEKDFDIEVTEDDINQVSSVVPKEDVGDTKDEDDDWENWE